LHPHQCHKSFDVVDSPIVDFPTTSLNVSLSGAQISYAFIYVFSGANNGSIDGSDQVFTQRAQAGWSIDLSFNAVTSSGIAANAVTVPGSFGFGKRWNGSTYYGRHGVQ